MPSLSQTNKTSPRAVLAIVCAGVVLASLDLFIVNVALPRIADDLHTQALGDLSWVLNDYAIVYASLLVLFGRLADRYPRKYGFLLGVAVFTVASAACGAATSVTMLVVFRLVQAAAAARCARGPPRGAWPRPWARSSAACWWQRAGAGSSWSTSRSA